MRKGWVITSVLLSSSLALSLTGCMDRTGDVGNKNIRPNNVNRYETSNRYYQNEMNRRFADDQANDMNRMNGRRMGNNNIVGMHGNTRLEMNQLLADKIAAMPQVDGAFVVTTNRNAYVAVTQKGHAGAEVTKKVKDQIADQVRMMSPAIENVYVSSNPDFVGRMQNYAAEIGRGHPIQGFIAEFNALAERIFPSNS